MNDKNLLLMRWWLVLQDACAKVGASLHGKPTEYAVEMNRLIQLQMESTVG